MTVALPTKPSMAVHGPAVLTSLEAFEAYAEGLHGLLGDLDLVTKALELLLVSSTGSIGAEADAVVAWCLDVPVLCSCSPAAVVRALLLRGALEGASVDAHKQILDAAPSILTEAMEPVAERLAGTLAVALPSDEEAASWLRSLRQTADMCAYARAAEALLGRHPKGSVWMEAWAAATEVMTGPNHADRRACAQRLLPPLVAMTPRSEAGEKLVQYVEALLEGPSRAEISDALSLAVSFHELLLQRWQLASPDGCHDELGRRLIAAGLRFGNKEFASCRRHARFLLESVIKGAYTDAKTESWLRAAGINIAVAGAAWRSYWELFDTLEEYSSHLLKASWEPLVGRMMNFLGTLKTVPASVAGNAGHQGKQWMPSIMSPSWLEVLFARALAHDNDTVQKFVLGSLVALDQGTACLSESFVLEEILPRLSHSIDILYPRADVHQVFERQVSSFFASFVQQHAEGPMVGSRRLLLALLAVPALHYTPLRVVLAVLVDLTEVAGAFQACEMLDIVEKFFSNKLMRMPVSVRPVLASLLLRAAASLGGTADSEAGGEAIACAAKAAAAIPDALLSDLRSPLRAVVNRTLGDNAQTLAVQFLQGLVATSTAATEGLSAAEITGRQALPMAALQFSLGDVRIFWALESSAAKMWTVVAPTLQDVHRRPYLPQRAVVAALFSAAYATALFPDGADALEQYSEVRVEVLAYIAARAGGLMDPAAVVGEEIAWVWLYALVFERLWHPGLAHGEAVMDQAAALLQRSAGAGSYSENAEQLAMSCVAATTLLGALAPKAACTEKRAHFFLVLSRAVVEKPSSVIDERFSIFKSEHLGTWARARNEEYEDLHRVEREGLGRVLEWRDTISVFLLAKWRALAALTRSDDLLAALAAAVPAMAETAGAGAPKTLPQLSAALLAEYETLQPPAIAFWAVVARRVMYPVTFDATAPEEDQADALRLLCSGLSGAIAEGTGDSSQFMPRGCMAELAASLCDPQLAEAERRLNRSGTLQDERPLTAAVSSILSKGEAGVGISRSAVVPLLSALLKPPRRYNDDEAALTNAAELLATLLLHREASIIDGSFCHAPEVATSVIDTAGPGGLESLERSCPGATALCKKFGGTPGLPRVLVLAALDALADSGDGALPPLIVATLRRLLAMLRVTLENILNPPGSKAVPNRPPTPMPLSQQHRTQLRGWQAVLILGCRADRQTAEFLLPELFFHLRVPHVPDVRDYQELLGCLLCRKFEDLAIEPLLVPALQNFDASVQVSASLLVMSSYLFRDWALAASAASPLSAACISLVRAAAPYLSHNSAYVRGTVAWGIFQVLSALDSGGLAAAPLSNGDAALLADIYRFLKSNAECIKMRKRTRPVFFDFDPVPQAALECLTDKSIVLPAPADAYVAANARATTAKGEEASSGKAAADANVVHSFADGDFVPTQTFLTLLKAEVAQEMEDLWDRSDPTTYPSLSEEWKARLEAEAARSVQQSEVNEPEEKPTPDNDGAAGGTAGLQRKFVPPEPAAHHPSDSEPGGTALSSMRRIRAPLIVIASLIDKAPNLAGLCRTCEIFSCQALCMANTKITKDQAFQSMSVTAEKWLPLREVPRGAALRAHLLQLRRQGYALVGVEQTHNSVLLHEWKFAPRTVLVLGAEKEGIDAELLPLLDGCVEIPQSGQIRSLNVHVSGSLAIWEYTRQNRSSMG